MPRAVRVCGAAVGSIDTPPAVDSGDCRFREAEIEQLRARFGQHDVRRFEIAMYDPRTMRGRQRVGNLDRDRQRLRARQAGTLGFGSRHAIRERLAFEELHDEKRRARVLADVVERADVRMRELRDDSRLAVEALAKLRVIGDRTWQDLDRHRAIEARVAGFVDLAHAARAKRAEDFIRTEPGAGRECQSCLLGWVL